MVSWFQAMMQLSPTAHGLALFHIITVSSILIDANM